MKWKKIDTLLFCVNRLKAPINKTEDKKSKFIIIIALCTEQTVIIRETKLQRMSEKSRALDAKLYQQAKHGHTSYCDIAETLWNLPLEYRNKALH